MFTAVKNFNENQRKTEKLAATATEKSPKTPRSKCTLRFEEVRNESTQGATTNTKATSISSCSIGRRKKKLSRVATLSRVTLDEVLPPALYLGVSLKDTIAK